MQTHRRNSQVPATSHSEREIKPPKTGSGYVSAPQQCWRMISIRGGKHCGHPAAFMSHTGSCGAGLNPASLPDHPRDRFRGERLAVNVPVKSPAVIFAGPSWDGVGAAVWPRRPAPGSARRAIGGPHICHTEPVISMPFLTARVSRQRARIPIPVGESLSTRTPLYGGGRS
jgi:hypothetical protein